MYKQNEAIEAGTTELISKPNRSWSNDASSGSVEAHTADCTSWAAPIIEIIKAITGAFPTPHVLHIMLTEGGVHPSNKKVFKVITESGNAILKKG